MLSGTEVIVLSKDGLHRDPVEESHCVGSLSSFSFSTRLNHFSWRLHAFRRSSRTSSGNSARADVLARSGTPRDLG